MRGKKRYEFSNHLGNVMVTLSDRRVWESNSSRWTADAISGQDYDPFGMVRPNRSVSVDGYRFGFNGKEKDSEFSNESYDFGARIYDGRVARWLACDPKSAKYQDLSAYVFAANCPVYLEDPDGEEWRITTTKLNDGTTLMVIQLSAVVIDQTTNQNVLLGSFIKAVDNQLKYSFEGVHFHTTTQYSAKEDKNVVVTEKIKVVVYTNIRVAKTEDEIKETDHVIRIKDDKQINDDRGKDNVLAYVNKIGGMEVNVKESVAKATGSNENVNTLAHELGHTLGLRHNDNKKDTKFYDKNIKKQKDNLMNTIHEPTDRLIHSKQIDMIRKAYNSGELNKR